MVYQIYLSMYERIFWLFSQFFFGSSSFITGSKLTSTYLSTSVDWVVVGAYAGGSAYAGGAASFGGDAITGAGA